MLIDAGVSPSDNVLGVYDTSLPVITHTYYDDTAITNYVTTSGSVRQAVGVMEDPFFGTITGSTFFQLLPTDASTVIYENKTIDSAVLVLPFTGVMYGDTTSYTTISYQAFFLTDDIAQSATYFSYTHKDVDLVNPLSEPMPVDLAHLRDSLEVAGKKYQPGLRIRLKLPTLLDKLMPALTDATNSTGDKNAAFLSKFKGVCVRVADTRGTSGVLPYFRLDGSTDNYSGAGILVYYHSNTGAADTLVQRYYFNANTCGFFNNVSRSYGHYPVNTLITSAQANDSVLGVQNVPGANIDIVIPGLKSLPSGVINKAEIQLAVLPWHKNDKYSAVDRLFPIRINNGIYPAGSVPGTNGQVLDIYSGASPFQVINGTLNTIDRDGTAVNVYSVNLPREVMASRKAGNDTLHLHLTGSQVYTAAFRAILGGGAHPNSLYRAKLFVVYSSLNKQ
ncbi:hypothetical protein GCM10023093_23590 [Nemorincola caseinilytica]|uniref:DUF4270 family protein n=1 Tax=Nemorincola caseinilytica TaxID=2054315 RepID=A0ABP8NHP1_9BACT